MMGVQDCPTCRGGVVFESPRFVKCPTCFGTGGVRPNRICRCGRSINFEFQTQEYCGRKKCLEKTDAKF
jgi:hypothetical protein